MRRLNAFSVAICVVVATATVHAIQLPISPNTDEAEGQVRATDATDFLKTQFAKLQLGHKRPESYRDDFARVMDVTPPDEWCYALAFQAFRHPKPRHAGQFRERTDALEKTVSPKGRQILTRRYQSCYELNNVPHLHTCGAEWRRLTRDPVGRILIDVGEQQFPLPKHALDRVPAFGRCLATSKLEDRIVVGQYDQIGSGFPLACIDKDSRSVLWKSRVTALPPKSPGYSGFWYHDVQFVQTQTRAAVFGIINGYCYAEVFDVGTGQRVLRFCPSND